MEQNKISGILSIILGLIFIIFPIISSATTSIIIGLSLLFLGIVIILNDFTGFNVLAGILSILFGLLFMFAINAVSFLVGLQFYIIGIIMIIAGITGIITDSKISKWTSLMILLLGIVEFILAFFSMAQPIYAAILIGLSLIIKGVSLYLN